MRDERAMHGTFRFNDLRLFASSGCLASRRSTRLFVARDARSSRIASDCPFGQQSHRDRSSSAKRPPGRLDMLMKNFLSLLQTLVISGIAAILGCGSPELDIESSASGVAPPGSAALFVSNTVPTTMAPGERLNVELVVDNIGVVDWANTGEWGLLSTNVGFGWSLDFIDNPVTQGNNSTHNLRITAPQTSQTFGANFYSFVSGQSGTVPGGTLSLPVTIDAGATPNWDCTGVSTTIPNPIPAGAVVDIDVTVQNTGLQTWPGGGQFCLYAREDRDPSNPNIFRWGSAACVQLATSVAPSATTTFSLPIQAPSVPGTYRFMRQILDSRAIDAGGIGFFRNNQYCVDESIVVNTAAPPLDAAVVSDTVPSTVAPSDILEVSVTMENTGTETWQPGTHFLYSENTPINLWGVTIIDVPGTIAQGQQATFTFPMRVSSTPATENFRFRMLRSGSGSFGTTFDETVVISGAATPVHAATVIAETLPASMAPSSSEVVTVTIRNDGSQTWLADGSYSLVSNNAPVNLWGITTVPVTTAVSTGNSFVFSFPVTAPGTDGTEAFQFRMFRSGLGQFGEVINEPVNISSVVTPPLDATVSSQTIPTTMEVDSVQTFTVAMTNSGTDTWPANGDIFLFSNNNPFQLFTTTAVPVTAATATGQDFTFIFSATAPSDPGTYTSTWQMHQTGGAGYFGEQAVTVSITVTAAVGCGDGVVSAPEACDDGNTTAGDGCSAACTIENQIVDLAGGPSDRTFFGFLGNRQLTSVRIQDLDGNGEAEVLMSDFTDIGELGVGRNEAGRVYVYGGGAGFFTQTSGLVNANPLITLWGREPGDWLGALFGGVRVGDVTDDGNADIVVGARRADGTGNAAEQSGEIYVLRGGTTLYAGGVFDLANTTGMGVTPASTVLGAVIAGEAAGDQLSLIAVGDVTNDGVDDIIAGATTNDSNGNNSGEVYVIAGGVGLASTSTIELSSATIAARITGPAGDAGLGRAAAIGDLTGDGINDLAISAPNYSSNGRSINGEVYILPGPVSGDIDLSGAFSGLTIVGENNWVNYGADLAIGDVGDTSAPDLIVGAPQALAGGLQVGEVHVWFGPLATSGTIDNAVTNSGGRVFGATFDFLGSSVEVADSNGDGLGDVFFGVGLSDGAADARNASGEVGLVLGQAAFGTVNWPSFAAPFRVYGEASEDGLGLIRDSVATGDVDGDGRADWCVGAQLGGDSVGPGAGRIDCFQSPW